MQLQPRALAQALALAIELVQVLALVLAQALALALALAQPRSASLPFRLGLLLNRISLIVVMHGGLPATLFRFFWLFFFLFPLQRIVDVTSGGQVEILNMKKEKMMTNTF